MKKALCIIITVLVIALSVITFTANAAQSSGLFSDSRGVYSVSCTGSTANIVSFGQSGASADVKLSYDIDAVCAADNKIVFFSNDPLDEQLVVTVYDLHSDMLDSFALNRRTVYSNSCCCSDRDHIYIGNRNQIEQYSYGGSYIRTFTLPDIVSYSVSGYDDGIYVISGDEVYAIYGDGMTLLSGADAVSPIVPVDSDHIVTGNGKLYTPDGTSVQTDANVGAGLVCLIGGILYSSSGSVIYGYDIDTGERLCSYQCSENVRCLYADGDDLIALDGDLRQIAALNSDSFSYPKNNTSGGANNQSPGGNQSGGQNTDGMPAISSDVYTVDLDDYIISRIPAGTTFAKFKSNMNCSGCSVKLYRADVEKASGNVGTAMLAVFSKGDSSVSFELSVIGDITGEGSANSRDLTVLLDYLIGSADFNGAYLLSADLNGDGDIDVSDAARLKRSY